MTRTEKLKKNGNIFISNQITQSLNQKQTGKVFSNMWSNSSTYNRPSKTQLKRDLDEFKRQSNNLIQKFISDYFKKNKSKKEIKFLDVGCGHGYTFKILFSKYIPKIKYIGIDLHDRLESTYTSLYPTFAKYNKRPILVKASMNKIPNVPLLRNLDLAFAEGTMHHSESVASAIKEIRKTLKKNGLFIFWIINQQKPIRKITDSFFRNHFKEINPKNITNEVKEIARLSIAFGKALKNDRITLKSNINSLNIKAGKYRLQEILYDYIIKFYYHNSSNLTRSALQFYDWVKPSLYHQTSQYELKKQLKSNKFKIIHYVEKTNGHFVVCKKI